jgi:putative transposase
MTTRKRYDSRIKAQVALEALKNQQTIAQIASEYEVHPNLVTQWKQRLLAEIPDIFSSKQQKNKQDSEAFQAELYRQIGQLKVELDWLKKNLELSIEQKRLLVEPVKHSKEHIQIPIFRQCELLDLARSSFYYEPAVVDEYNLLLMRLIDEQYTQTPFY